MATPAHAQAVKSLNTSPGRRRFVFKSFSERIEGIDINVFRSLEKIKSEPSEGSFFRDCLIEWRELNTAEDFITFYSEIMPFVQTLPLVLLHKELIFSNLISRLHMKARLSLEAILRLLASLSRDLLQDFIPLLPKIADSLVSLLESGGDREPEIVEQIFTSWSSILMHLQKYLVKDVTYVLKVTVKLRYYPKDYIQEFMAESTSFLLRNAPLEQLIRGTRKVILEVMKKPLSMRKTGVAALLSYAMLGNSSRFHSGAERVLRLVLDSSLYSVGYKFAGGQIYSHTYPDGPYIILEVVISILQRLSEELQPKELTLIWDCIYQEIRNCLSNGSFLHLSRLLSLFVSTVQFNGDLNVSDYQEMLKLVDSLVQKLTPPSIIPEEQLSEIVDKLLRLVLHMIDGLHKTNNMSTIAGFVLRWAPIFELRNLRFLDFVAELLRRDSSVVYMFRDLILSTISSMVKSSTEEVLPLLLSFCEKMHMRPDSSCFLKGDAEGALLDIHSFMQEAFVGWIRFINDIVLGKLSSAQLGEMKLAVLWVIIRCYPHVMDASTNISKVIDLIDALDHLLMVKEENIAGISRYMWQSLIGAALHSHNLCPCDGEFIFLEMSKVLHLAKTHKSSPQVLVAVADYLDLVKSNQCGLQADDGAKTYHPELTKEKAVDAVAELGNNLSCSEKSIRLATLRILCHYEPFDCEVSAQDELLEKKSRTAVSQASELEDDKSPVLKLLLTIEETPLSVSTSRRATLLISKIQMGISGRRISGAYAPLLLNGIIGIFHNRFSYLWTAVTECLAVLISKHVGLVWDDFIFYFEKCQSSFLTSRDQVDRASSSFPESYSDLDAKFNLFATPAYDSTPCATVLSSLLLSLQKVPSVVESRSRQITTLFLRFLGYDTDNLISVGAYNSSICKGKQWKDILKEWLKLLRVMRNLKSSYQNHFLKDVLQNRLLDEYDPELQMRVLDCLLLWKDEFLTPYDQHLRNLIIAKTLREELTTWSLSKESCAIEESHRVHLIPLVIRLLMPKVRKLKTLASRKHTSVHHRKAILGFIAQVEVEELPLFFVLLMKSIHIVPNGADEITTLFRTCSRNSMAEFLDVKYLQYCIPENVTALPLKRKHGFLHVIKDVLGSFDELHIRPFLDLVMGCVVRLLRSSASGIDAARGVESYSVGHNIVEATSHEKQASTNCMLTAADVKQLKDLRSLCLKVLSLVLNKYEDHEFGNEFWDLFFNSVEPLINAFKQEGSSSEKPSSLFSCFLAMSRSHRLVSLLCKNGNLVPDIFSILSVTSASEAIISCVMAFIENLLNLDSELDDENSLIKGVLHQNMETLICSLHCLYLSDGASRRKLVRFPLETEIRILKSLSRYMNDLALGQKLGDILLALISKKRVQSSDICTEAIQVLKEIVPVLETNSTTKILNAVSPLLISAEHDMRLCICSLLETLARTDTSVAVLAGIICKLNASSDVEIGGLDYDTIVVAYEEIGVESFSNIHVEHAMVILSQCVHDMSSEELIIRHSAYRSLLTLLDFATQFLGGVVEGTSRYAQVIRNAHASWTRTTILRVMNKIFLKYMGDAVSRGSSGKKEWIDLLREMVMRLPDAVSFSKLRTLCSEDADQDFFTNIIHLQKHRRAKALLHFRDVMCSTSMPEEIANNLFIPLFFNILYDLKHGKDEHVRSACLQALATVSACMEWKSYSSLLMRCFQEMKKNTEKQNVLMRLVCSILDHFHFSPIHGGEEAEGSSRGGETVGSNSQALVQKHDSSSTVAEIQTFLDKIILPKMLKLLNSGSDKIDVNINLAALKLLKLLPGDAMDMHLSSLVHRISNFLRSRVESTRDEARSVLADCLKELGLEYLQFIVHVLQSTLKRGFELHVLGYTLHFLLYKVLPHSATGKLDYCLDDLLDVVENDILGNVAEEKEVEKIASKMKETKKCKSFETLKLIAENIKFKDYASKLLSPVTKQLQKHFGQKVKAKLENMLNHIAAGIECNPSVDQTDLFIFLYGLIEDGLNERISLDKSSLCGIQEDKLQRSDAGCIKVNSHIVVVFALGVFVNRVKHIKMNNDEQMLSMLDPFIKLLGNCLNSKYEDILSVCLRCLIPLVRLPLPSLGSEADKLMVLLLDIAQGSVDHHSPLTESCFKLLTVLLRSTKITLSSDQLRLLIQFPVFVDLGRQSSIVALSLLKAIVGRKLVVPEIYDLAVRVSELMITSQSESVRRKCSRILLQFFASYNLSEKRWQQHLDFLLAQLRYEHPAGREAVLEMLHAIIVKFSENKVNSQSQTIFIHLVECLANDDDNRVRSMTAGVIKLLVGRISQQSLDFVLECCLLWYSGEKQQLWSSSAQVLGLLVEVMKKNFRKHGHRVFPVARHILKSAVKDSRNMQLDLSGRPAIPLWRESYYTLIMLEKILLDSRDLILDRETEDMWIAICELLLHPHAWLHSISGRLVCLYFTTAANAIREHPEKSLDSFMLTRPSRLFTIAVSLCCQLKAQETRDDDADKKITENLVFAICGLHSATWKCVNTEPARFWSSLEQDEQGLFLNAFKLLNSRRARAVIFAVTSGVDDQISRDQVEDFPYLLISTLIREMGELAVEGEANQMKVAFGSFQRISQKISQVDLQRIAGEMLLPLYKVCEGLAGKVISDDMKQFAEKVCDTIRNSIGSQNFIQIYSDIQKKIKTKREKRKREEKVMAVVNPTRNAKRKMRVAAKHRAQKKRKIMTLKMERWMR